VNVPNVTIISGTCDKCQTDCVYGEGESILQCACGKLICEGCEVQHCEQGHHDCPFCGAMIARCFDSEDDLLDEATS
jgi:hypothetical protein